jgi:hypothetical protein
VGARLLNCGLVLGLVAIELRAIAAEPAPPAAAVRP